MIAKSHIICNDRVDLKDRFDVSSHELSPFLITIILTTANDEILYKDASPMIQEYFVIQKKPITQFSKFSFP